MTIGDRLRKLRQIQAGMTLKEVSEITAIPVSTLSDIERGKSKPAINVVSKLADLYKVPIDTIIEEANFKTNIPINLLNIKKEFNIPEEIIDIMIRLQSRSNKSIKTKNDWLEIYFSINKILGENNFYDNKKYNK